MAAGPGTEYDGQPSARVLPRPRTRSFFDAVARTPLSLVVAPAGTGKTAAVAAWSRDRPGPDLHRLCPTVDAATAAGLVGTGGADRVVVVDDAHRLSEKTAAALADVLASGSAHAARLLLISRRAPAWVPVSLALEGRLNVLRFPDLRFGSAEAVQLVRLHRPTAGDAEVGSVLDHSDGWAAALVLGALALDPASPGRLPVAVQQPVLDYLLAEVFADLPPALRQVLAATGHEDRVSAEEVVVLSGIADAADLLEAAADGLLVSASRAGTHSGGATWRLHPLLTEMLRRRAAASEPDRLLLAAAHQRAAHHHRRQGGAAEAVRHATLGGDRGLLLAALRDFAPELIARERTDLLAGALAVVPPQERGTATELLALDALILRSTRRFDAAKRVADRALRDGVGNEPGTSGERRDLDADLAILDVWQARCGWRPVAAALDRAHRVLGCHHDPAAASADPTHGHETTGITPLRSAWLMLDVADLELWSGAVGPASVHVQAVDAYAQGARLPQVSCAVLAMRASIEMVRGAYQSAATTAGAALTLRAEAGLPENPATARCHLVRGWARFHALDLDRAGEDLAAAAEGHDPSDPFLVVYRRLLEAHLLLARGRLGEARRLLDGEAAVPGGLPGYARRHLCFARFRVAGYAEDPVGMTAEERTLRRAGYDADADLAEALVRGLSGSEAGGIHDLDVLLDRAELRHDGAALSRVTAASAAVGRAALLHRIGTPDALARAAAHLPDVLGRVAPHRLWWLLATGTMLSPGFLDLVAAEAVRPGGHPAAAEANAVLQRRPLPYPDRTTRLSIRAGAATGPGPEHGGLTPRELDVLRALTSGGSNSAIAQALHVTENTVKTHLAAVYRKLDVDGRVGATREARRRGLR